jgi:hypothetical protein
VLAGERGSNVECASEGVDNIMLDEQWFGCRIRHFREEFIDVPVLNRGDGEVWLEIDRD